MFVNDLTGTCRSNIFGGDITSQVPVGFHAAGNVPYGYGLGYNVAGQVCNPYGYLINRIPQTFVHQGFQGFVPQTLGQGFVPQNIGQGFVPQNIGQGFVPQNLGQVNPIVQNPFLFAANPLLAHNAMTANTLGYGFSPYTFGNWNWSIPQGFQSTICR